MHVTRLLIGLLAGLLAAAALSLVWRHPAPARAPAIAQAPVQTPTATAPPDASDRPSPPYGALVFAAPAALVLLRGRRRR